MKKFAFAALAMSLCAPLAAHARLTTAVQSPQSLGTSMLNGARQAGENDVNTRRQAAMQGVTSRLDAARKGVTTRRDAAISAYTNKKNQLDQSRQQAKSLTTMPSMPGM
ncbi:hypothetical protein KGY14_10420 [Ameyamaea chiangmaiensis]|uniref:Uncharacterized protein n=1 Tax=Ameyamaea chiangmaiensis TaxID=442969 RepID=A0A850PCZ3_9PROT|nr:hypothetical protein [Ameyamaea chiangmaiensis]MBS4075605.1 hypothetical protein [Ameyamaea chiangmaiensis]NVN40156.1 hypothetical protein [Ameyamaea chiangmaiensis]